MSKHTRFNDDEPAPKRLRIDEGRNLTVLALCDTHAWEILKQFLTSDMTMAQMDDALIVYLSDQYSADDWGQPKASEDGEGDEVGQSEQLQKVTHLPETSVKDKLAKKFDNLANRIEENSTNSSQGCHALTSRAALISSMIPLVSHKISAPETRMYLLHIQRTVTEFIAEHLRGQRFSITISAWIAGQLYMVADSPKTIAESLPTSHCFALKQCLCITEAECEAVEGSLSQLPSPVWHCLINHTFQLTKSGWDKPFLKKAVVAFSMQFLHAGNWARVIKDSLHGELSRLPMQQHLKPPSDFNSNEIGDYIEVLDGEHMGKCSVMNWYYKGATNLWFWDILDDKRECSDGLWSISVPVAMVQQTNLAQTIQYTKDRGYDIRLGDVMIVLCGLEYQMKGVMHNVNFPNTCLTILSDGDQSLVKVPIRFVTKICNAFLDSFKKGISREVFVIRGDRKGCRATLYSLSLETCTIAVHGQQAHHTQALQHCHQVWNEIKWPSIAWSTWPASSKAIDMTHNPTLSATPSTSTSDPWTVDAQDNTSAKAENLPDSGLLPWLMSKEFSSKLSTHQALLKVSPRFLRGKLYKRFVSTACSDPFCSENGPTPEGCVTTFCTSNSQPEPGSST
ncbi:uncharacterized protein BJ212DRAFT_1303361 [Suillus subaureus]|uniref:Uncharacterized protein n=1 Tax=Suillus subaureus TaxID=48587 RepID=A0A9P7E065_9AGAM|nr:uncharacterized protein BJ212DRAFT_1303361 [Suillus subaureus]KAG1807644.1 hypothetical protein BJ212DRAFT_1303361 [Suillus subaureus]